MVRQIVIAMGLSLVLTVAFLLMMIRSTTGGDRLCSVGKAVLQDVSGQSVEIGGCTVDPIGTRLTVRNVRIGPADNPLFQADRISAGIDHQGFLAGKIRIDQVEIVRPQVALDLSKPRPQRAAEIRPPGAACLPDLGRLEMGTATLVDGEMHIRLPDGRSVDEKGMQAELHGDGEKLSVAFKAASSTYADEAGATTATRASIKGDFDLNAGTARLQSVDISAPEGSLFAEGQLSSICNVRGSVSATLQADFRKLHDHLLRNVENLSGTGTFRATVAFDGPRFDARAEANLHDLKALNFAPGTFSAAFRATPEALEVTRFDLPLETGKVTATGRLGLASPYPLTADANLDKMVLGELMERLGEHDLPLQLLASGKASLSGPLATEEGPALDVSLDASVPEFGVYDRSYKRRNDRSAQRYIAFRKGAIKGSFRIGSHALELTRAHIAANDTDIDLSGTIYFDAAKGMRLRFDSSHVRLDELGPFGPAQCDGLGQLHGTVAGPYAGLDIDAQASIKGLTVQGYEIGDVAAKRVRLDLDEHTLEVRGIDGVRGASTFTGDALLSFAGKTTLEARMSLDDAHLLDLVNAARGRFPSLAKLEGNVDALVTGDLEISGPTDAFDMGARLTLKDVALYGQKFDSGILRASMRRGEELRVQTLELDRDSARVFASGSLQLEDLGVKLRLATRGLQLKHIDALGARATQSTGSVYLRATVAGTIDEPTLDGKLLINDWMLGNQPVATVQLSFAIPEPKEDTDDTSGPRLTIIGTITSPWPTSLPHPPHVAGTLWPPPPHSMVHDILGELILSGEMPFDLNVGMSVPDVRILLPEEPRQFNGGLAGRLHTDGTLSNLADATATLDLTRLWLAANGTKLEAEKKAEIRLEHGQVSLANLEIGSGPDFHLTAYGARDSEGHLDFRAEGGLDLSVLRKQFPDFEESFGHLGLDLHLTGTQAQPAFVGHATLDGVAMRLAGLPIALKQGQGAVTFGKGLAILESFTGDLNGGPLSIKGSVTLDSGYIPGGCAFQAEMKNIPVTWDEIPMVIAGTPELTRESASDNLKLGGKMQLVRLRYTKDQELEKTILRAVENMRRPPTLGVFAHSKKEFLTFNLPIALEDVRVENNLAKASVNGDVTLVGTNKHYGLLGTVTVTDGKAYIRNNEFKVSSAVINFTDPSGIKPTFDVRADSIVRNEYLVHVSATGTPSKPDVVFSAEPVLSQADIVMLLTVGVTSKDFSSAGSGALGGALLDSALSATNLPGLFKNLLPKNDILRNPTFHVSSGYNPMTQNTEPLAVFEGKLLRDDWTVQGQTSLLGHAGSTKASIDVKLRKNISASAQWNEDPSAPNSGDLGGDVRFHWEAP